MKINYTLSLSMPGILFICQWGSTQSIVPAQQDFQAVPFTNEETMEDAVVSDPDLFDGVLPDLNVCNAADLKRFPFLQDEHISAILAHRSKYGPFISVFELQTVHNFPDSLLSKMEPMVTCSMVPSASLSSIYERKEKNSFTIKIRTPGSPDDSQGHYGGNAAISMRYKGMFFRQIKAGIMLEKDAGEPFLWKGAYQQSTLQRSSGFDHTLFTAHWLRPTRRISQLIFGGYRISLGQGLLLWQGFPSGKSALTMQIQKPEMPPQAVFSTSESDYLNGMATQVTLTSRWKMTAFLSGRRQDAVLNRDSLAGDDEPVISFAALDIDGYHRTESEIRSRNTLGVYRLGSVLQYSSPRLKLGINGLATSFSNPLIRPPALYRHFLFEGSHLVQGSIDYRTSLASLTIFGEHAISDNGKMAHITGLQSALHRSLDLCLQLRHLDPGYHTLTGNVLSESSLPNNESGVYLGMEWRPVRNFTVNAYTDMWRHPWLGYQRSAPAAGNDYLVRCLWRKKRFGEAYIQWKQEYKLTDATEHHVAALIPAITRRLRCHVQMQVLPSWQWRCRAEWSQFKGESTHHGFLLFQDLIYKPLASTWSATTRVAWVDIEDFTARIYSYEHDVLYTSSIPFLQGKGTRFYIVIRKKFNAMGIGEVRWARDVRALTPAETWEKAKNAEALSQLTIQWTLKW